MRQAGFHVRVVPSNIDETHHRHERPSTIVRRLALAKARHIAAKRKKGIVIGADTIVVLGKRILGKPASRRDAVRMLRLLSDRTHGVYTGVALVQSGSGKHVVFHEFTRVRFRRIPASEIRAYVRSGSPLDKAGAYGIQDDYGAVFVEKVAGCFYNVVGFPLSRFYAELKVFQGKAQLRNLR